MKKILLLALAIVASATFSTAVAGKKDKKKKAQTDTVMTCCKPAVQVRTSSDTVSYAAGLAATQGLQMYLQERLHVDTAYMADFVRGYREAIAKAKDPAFVAYSAGASIAEQAKNQILPGVSRNLEGSNDSIEAALFHEGFLAGVMNDTTLFKVEAANMLVQNRVMAAQKAKNEAYKELNAVWLKDNASNKVIKEGTGAKPEKTQTVEVVYEGKTIDGNVFDATSRHGSAKTDKFRCDQVIKGWTEALTSMKVGSKWEIYIPQELAYGERQAGSIKPYSTLIFTVELVGIEPEAKPAATTTPAKKTTKRKK